MSELKTQKEAFDFLVDVSYYMPTYKGKSLKDAIELAKGPKVEMGRAGKGDAPKPPVNRFIYHYSAQYQLVDGQISYWDGIAMLDSKIKTMDGYRILKKLIDSDNHKRLTINSLSLIGMEND